MQAKQFVYGNTSDMSAGDMGELIASIAFPNRLGSCRRSEQSGGPAAEPTVIGMTGGSKSRGAWIECPTGRWTRLSDGLTMT